MSKQKYFHHENGIMVGPSTILSIILMEIREDWPDHLKVNAIPYPGKGIGKCVELLLKFG
ncbi:hypothetical protein ApAK_01045 [Thermoplasmatales archaeon AK]|nr:hypothetical protein [Thermoplasmatales archaeon AK]